MIDILAVGAHPDDVEIGCGGSLLLAARQGKQIVVADLTAGEHSTRGTLEIRAAEKARAASLLHAQRRCLDLPDSRLEVTPEQRQPIIALIRELKPAVVLAPYPTDKHPDHAAAGVLVQEACYLAGVQKAGEGTAHRPRWLFQYMLHEPFTPSFVIDVTPTWDDKQQLIAAYHSQFSPDQNAPPTAISQPRFLKVLEARAIWFGAMIGATYGEAFHTAAPVPLAEIPNTPAYSGLPAYNPYL
jgi:N-acetylglucosamine malate deacetylase 1